MTRRRELGPLRALARALVRPVYERLWGGYQRAAINRLNETLGELHEQSAGIAAVQAELRELRVRQDALEAQISALAPRRWDATALARRLGAIEDRLAQDDGATVRAPGAGAAAPSSELRS